MISIWQEIVFEENIFPPLKERIFCNGHYLVIEKVSNMYARALDAANAKWVLCASAAITTNLFDNMAKDATRIAISFF